MSHDDFVTLVLDANLDTFFTNTLVLKKLKKFAESVELAEREVCAKLCDAQAESPTLTQLEKYRASFIAAAIRSRK